MDKKQLQAYIKDCEDRGFKGKIWHEIIQLYPTTFRCHVFVSTNPDLSALLQSHLFSRDYEYWREGLSKYCAWRINYPVDESNNEKSTAIHLHNYNAAAIAHEANHVMNYLSEYTGVEIGPEAAEWNCWFLDSLVDRIMDMKTKDPLKI